MKTETLKLKLALAAIQGAALTGMDPDLVIQRASRIATGLAEAIRDPERETLNADPGDPVDLVQEPKTPWDEMNRMERAEFLRYAICLVLKQHEGGLTAHQIKEMVNENGADGASYAQVNYILNSMEGVLLADKSHQPHRWHHCDVAPAGIQVLQYGWQSMEDDRDPGEDEAEPVVIESSPMNPKTYDDKLAFAKSVGFKSVSAGINAWGQEQFENEFQHSKYKPL